MAGLLNRPAPTGHLLTAAIAVAALALVMSLAASAPAQVAALPDDEIRLRIDRILGDLSANDDYDVAERALVEVFDDVILEASADRAELFRDASFALRLVRLVRHAEVSDRRDTLVDLIEHPGLARELAFLVRPDDEDPTAVLSLYNRIRRARGERTVQYASLTAAICVVHDKPLARRINENSATAPDPLAIFDYYAANESKMYFGIRNVPAELLIYVVDAAASIEEMSWALGRYAGHREVGRLFFEIDYDTDHLRRGTPKKVTVAGWSLPNILRHGGVCADQAHYAVTVGKSIGVPTAYTRGRDATVSHAWVGFLQSDGRRGWWNFDVGRYETYRGVRGFVLDPQTRRQVPDSYISLLAEQIHATADDRHAAIALRDAALRLVEIEHAETDAGSIFLDDDEAGDERAREAVRAADLDAQLDLIEQALRQNPGYADGWFAVRDLAQAGRLSLEEKKRWARVLDRLCGDRYLDFSWAILEPMIETIADPPEQNKLWNAAFDKMRRAGRLDLAAQVRLAQGDMWQAASKLDNAGQCYEDVLKRFANAGPFVITALRRTEALLEGNGRADLVVPLYEQTWSRIQRPKDMAGAFARQSNWSRVGTMYLSRLRAAGRSAEAQRVEKALNSR